MRPLPTWLSIEHVPNRLQAQTRENKRLFPITRQQYVLDKGKNYAHNTRLSWQNTRRTTNYSAYRATSATRFSQRTKYQIWTRNMDMGVEATSVPTCRLSPNPSCHRLACEKKKTNSATTATFRKVAVTGLRAKKKTDSATTATFRIYSWLRTVHRCRPLRATNTKTANTPTPTPLKPRHAHYVIPLSMASIY